MSEDPDTIYTEVMEWEGVDYVIELIDTTDFSDLEPVTQVQAVCFCGHQAVLYEDADGNFGLPGGTVEVGESYRAALECELYEEAAVETKTAQPLLYLRTYRQDTPGEISYQLRYWAEVEPLDEPVNDPDGVAVDRLLCSPDEALERLDWGRTAEIFFSLAQERRDQRRGL